MAWRCIGDRWVDGLGGLEGWRDEWGAGWARGLARWMRARRTRGTGRTRGAGAMDVFKKKIL